MLVRVFMFVVIAVLLVGGAAVVQAQADEFPDASSRDGRRRPDQTPFGLKDMLAKQRTEREKRDHQEMLDRGDEALRLAKQLEAAYEQNGTFSSQDRVKLDTLEKTVTKIRKELGASDDSEAGPLGIEAPDDPKPTTTEEAFKFLQSNTVKLVDELKKTSRFTVSVIAIQSTNSVLKIVRFLRLRK